MTREVQGVSLEEDGTIIIHWADPKRQSELGGTAFQSYITVDGQESDEQVAYYAKELRQDVVELLEAAIAAGIA